jgi:outer membrane protein assembly factor BamD (BamD/ComL family)
MKLIKTVMIFMGAFVCAAAFSGCYTGPVTIPDDAGVAEIVQMGQTAIDKNRYAQALQYYAAIKERFPDNSDAVAGADYEIAFLHYKQKNYSGAREEFEQLLTLYETTAGESLPRKYQILSRIVLKKIDEKQKIIADE